jgi:hypothetical protein
VAKTVQFIPKFKGAAEMEARRKLRMMGRAGPGGAPPPPPPPPVPVSWDSSSDEDEAVQSDDDDDEEDVFGNVSMDDGDEFDP